MPINFLKNYFKKLPLAFLLLLVVFAASLFLFGLIAHEVLGEKEEGTDRAIFNFFSAHIISAPLTAIMKAVTYCASPVFLGAGYGLVVLWYLFTKEYRRSAEILVIGVGGFLVNFFMKLFYHRPRPADSLIGPVQQFSFPSGHATSGFIFYGLLAYLVWKSTMRKRYKFVACSLLILYSLLIGFSRIYLRVHYTSDVVAGFCIGFAWLILSVWMLEYMRKRASVISTGK